jgi:hypothetical protein
MRKSWQVWGSRLAVLGLFTGLTVVITYPLPLLMSRVLAGGDIDNYLNPWADWWTHHVVTTPGQSLYYTDYLFYPDGVSLIFHSFSHVNTAISLILQPWIGQPAAHNVTIMLAYLLSAFGMYLLVEHLTASTAAGVVAGVVFAFNPYHIFESAHTHLVSTQWMPLSLLFLVRWLQERKRWHVVVAVLFFLLNALTGWHLMTLFSLWLVAFATYYLAFERRPPFWQRVEGLAVFALLAGLSVLPFLWPLLSAQLTASQSYMSVPFEKGIPMDLRNLVLPPWIEPIRWAGYLGLVAVLLAGIGLWKGERKARMWWGSAVLFLLIAIGPHPQIHGETVETITLPWSLIFIPLLRHPLRFHLLVMFGLAGAAGYGWTVVQNWLKRLGWGTLGLLGVLSLLVLDYSHWPFPTITPVVSPFYEQLAMEPGDFAIAPLPSGRQSAKYHMYYQTIHGKQIVGGHVSRTPRDANRFAEEHALIRLLRRAKPVDSEITDISRQFHGLAEVGIRYLVLHKDQLPRDLVEQWKAFLTLQPAYEDEHLIAYRTDLRLGRDYSFAYALTPALGLLQVGASPRDEVLQGTFVGLEIYWGAAEPPGRDLATQIEFVDEAGDVAQVERVALYPDWPSARWPLDTIAVDRYRVRIDAGLPAGKYDVRVGAVDRLTGEPIGEPVTVATQKVKPVTRTYEPPAPQFQVEGCFGDRLCVLGYDVGHRDDRLVLVFYWQAAHLMEQDYVMSTRLVELPSGVVVWANDAAARDWSYPTTWWDVGEVVSDTVVCGPDGVSAGRYGLAVVVYDPRSGDVLNASGSGQSVGQVLRLGEVDVP